MSTMYEDVDMENPDGVYGDGSDVCDGLIGVVVNCLSLNIREKASADSNVIAEAKALDELKTWQIPMMIGMRSVQLPVSKAFA